MFDAAHFDPVFLAQVRHSHPAVWPNHRRFVQLADAEDRQRLEDLDAELDILCARRLAILARLDVHRSRLWPRREQRHVRRPGGLGDAPCPPAPVDARPVSGSDLRHVMVVLLHRHGPVTLRELHGLLHRYGYAIESERPVQRLGDAAAYEVRQGRLVKHGRGVYGPSQRSSAARSRDEEASVSLEPLPWTPPELVADPQLARDPERWTDQRWPASAQLGSPFCDGSVDPRVRGKANELQFVLTATRERLAELVADRLGPPPPRLHPRYQPGADTPLRGSTQTFGDDSSTNRRQRSDPGGRRSGERGASWEELADDEVVDEWPDDGWPDDGWPDDGWPDDGWPDDG